MTGVKREMYGEEIEGVMWEVKKPEDEKERGDDDEDDGVRSRVYFDVFFSVSVFLFLCRSFRKMFIPAASSPPPPLPPSLFFLSFSQHRKIQSRTLSI